MSGSANCASRLVVPAPAEPDIHLLSRAPKSRHRGLSLCSLPVPKQFVVGLWSFNPFAQSATRRDLAACASMNPDVFAFSLLERFLGCCCAAAELLGSHKVLFPALHREHIADHLPGNRERGAIRISALSLSFIKKGQLLADVLQFSGVAGW